MSALPSLTRTTSARIPTAQAEFTLIHYRAAEDGKEHLAVVLGEVNASSQPAPILVRVHSECFTGDVLGSLRCDCGEQLQTALRLIAAEDRGVLIYLRQEGRGIGLEDKLRAYNLQDAGYDTVDANQILGHQADERDYSAAAQILADLGIQSIRLLTNNPHKVESLASLGLSVEERVPLEAAVTTENVDYLRAKAERMRHLLHLPPAENGTLPPLPATGTGSDLHIAEIRSSALRYHQQTGLPFVTLAYAQTLNGVIGSTNRGPLAISSPQATLVTHALRAVHDAILVGINTVISDNPRLTVRLVEGPHPQPVVLDTHLRFPPNAALLDHPKGVWIATASTDPARSAELSARGAELLRLPLADDGLVDLLALVRLLGDRGIRSLMVEGGAGVLSQFLRHNLAHRMMITISPRTLNGITLFAGDHAALPQLHNVSHTSAGSDVLLWGTPANVALPIPDTAQA
jgi:GTP cyclohydrolase II